MVCSIFYFSSSVQYRITQPSICRNDSEWSTSVQSHQCDSSHVWSHAAPSCRWDLQPQTLPHQWPPEPLQWPKWQGFQSKSWTFELWPFHSCLQNPSSHCQDTFCLSHHYVICSSVPDPSMHSGQHTSSIHGTAASKDQHTASGGHDCSQPCSEKPTSASLPHLHPCWLRKNISEKLPPESTPAHTHGWGKTFSLCHFNFCHGI